MFQRISAFFLFGLMYIAFGGIEQVVTAQPTAGLDDLVESGAPERIATGFSFTEGPVWHPDGYLLFSYIPGNTIYNLSRCHQWTLDGKQLYFSSFTPLEENGKPKKDWDIWVAEQTDQGWSDPKNLGTKINTDYRESSPSITADGTLYFKRSGEGESHDPQKG